MASTSGSPWFSQKAWSLLPIDNKPAVAIPVYYFYFHVPKAWQNVICHDGPVFGQVDPTRLAAECDRVVYNMDVQFRLLGGRSLSTPEGFCAVMIDMVMPIDQEPECMRLLEDIVHAHFEFIGTKHFWPDIIHENHFDQAFMTACLEDKKLSTEAKGRDAEFGVGADECKLSLEKLMAVDLSNATKMPVFLADVCPLIGKPLPALSEPPKPTYVSTTRALTAAMFQRAAHLTHLRAGNSSTSNLSWGIWGCCFFDLGSCIIACWFCFFDMGLCKWFCIYSLCTCISCSNFIQDFQFPSISI